MVQIVLVGLVAGVAGALLFMSPIGGTTLAFPLFTLCGLPIAIAGLGWTMVAGLIGSAVAAIVVLVAISGSAAIVPAMLHSTEPMARPSAYAEPSTP